MQKEMLKDNRIIGLISLIATISTIIATVVAVREYSSYLISEEFGLIGATLFLILIIQFQDLGLSTYTTSRTYNKISNEELLKTVNLYFIIILSASILTVTIFCFVRRLGLVEVGVPIFLICFSQIFNIYLTNLAVLKGKLMHSSGVQFIYAFLLLSVAKVSSSYYLKINQVLLLLGIINALRLFALYNINNIKISKNKFNFFNEYREYINILRNSFETYKLNLMIGLGYQADKIIAINIMTISQLGEYYIINQFASGVTLFTGIVSNYFSVEIVRIENEREKVIAKLINLILNIIAPLYLLVILHIQTILSLWLKNENLIENIKNASLMVTGGAMLNALTIPLYGYLIAQNKEIELRKLFVKLFIISTPLTLILFNQFGLTGAAISIAVYNILYFTLIIQLTAKIAYSGSIKKILEDIKIIEIFSPLIAIYGINYIGKIYRFNDKLLLSNSMISFIFIIFIFLIINKDKYK